MLRDWICRIVVRVECLIDELVIFFLPVAELLSNDVHKSLDRNELVNGGEEDDPDC